MPEDFHNPFQFVPHTDDPSLESAPLVRDADTQSRRLDPWPTHLTHDRFVPSTFSGRLVCRLTVCELLALGAQQEGDGQKGSGARDVSLFRIGDQWAIPGSSLRGMISAIAEAASDSAFRVLENEEWSRSAGPRHRVPLGQAHDYFTAEKRPLQLNDERQLLSLAEQLFGVVEEVPSEEKTRKTTRQRAFALASRLRISNALPEPHSASQLSQPEVTPIMASPKPPSAALYVHPKSGPGHVPTAGVDAALHRPNGRKFYLHRRHLEEQDWRTADPRKNAHQKAKVAPLKSGSFWFHLDFDNLSPTELDLLCYALAPSPQFRHKLGMGKALGLGKVHLQPMGLFIVDRLQRYQNPTSQRYHRLWRAETDAADEWPAAYQREKTHPATAEAAPTPQQLSAQFRETHPQLRPILDALKLIGDPDQIHAPVHYPQPSERKRRPIDRLDDPAMEEKSYEWFQYHERLQEPAAGPVSTADGIPKLKRHPFVPANGGPPRPRQRPAATQTPSQKASSATFPADLIHTTQSFHILKRTPKKLQFQIVSTSLATSGSLSADDRQRFLERHPEATVDATPYRLEIVGYTNGSFQLRLPQDQDTPPS